MHNIFRNCYISPLRYPGGKRKLLPLLTDLITQSGKVSLLVEPFAGGASISLGLLEAGLVDQIALSDKDELVAGFWATVFSKNVKSFADKVASTAVTLDEWRRQRSFVPVTNFDKAFKCLFLNRTSFSGILKETAGPIGGQKQESKYAIDCRFNQDMIARRILVLGELRERVLFVRRQSYIKTINDINKKIDIKQQEKEILWYLDPPFFKKAEHLYRYTFDKKGHKAFKKNLNKLNGRWILSYDDVPEARTLYNTDPGFARVNLSYNARIDSNERLIASEIIVSNIIAMLRNQGHSDVPLIGEAFSLGGFKRQNLPLSINKYSMQDIL